MLNAHTIILALVQSATEFLPVSSSAHLVILPRFMSWEDQGLTMDIALHLGTLMAVIVYFFKDFLSMFRGVFVFRKESRETKLVLKLAIAVIPALVVGLFIHDYMENVRDLRLIACTLIGFGILLYIADRYSPSGGNVDSVSYKHALIIGLAQAVALIPGVSRSGITMTAARFCGIGRVESARFSMLLAIPTIAAASLWAGYKIYAAGEAVSMELLYGAFFACVFGILAIWCLMNVLKRCSFLVFSSYRVVLGMILLAFAYNLI